jgi:hypothetical protein
MDRREPISISLVGCIGSCSVTHPNPIPMTVKQTPLIIAALLLLGGCASTNEAISNKPFQKRKLRSGWYVNLDMGQHQQRAVRSAQQRTRDQESDFTVEPLAALPVGTSPLTAPTPATGIATITTAHAARPQAAPADLTASLSPVPVPVAHADVPTAQIKSEASAPAPASPPAGEGGGTNPLAIAGFITSLFLPIVGLVLSAIALGQIKRTGQRGRGLAMAGLIIGIVFTVIALAVIV